jgi:putative acetyltransferase
LKRRLNVRIRLANESDVPTLAGLFRRSIEGIGPQRYSAEQVRAWASRPENSFFEFILDVTTYVADQRGRVVGFCGLGPEGYISSLYVDPEEGRKGIGSTLLQTAIDEARARKASRLHTEASEFSKPLFEKFGFETIELEHVVCRGVTFDRYRMQRTL